MSGLNVHQHDPSDAVERTFLRIERERMADVPMLNPALHVKAVDFQRWQGQWLGILVTPWCMSVLLVRASEEDWIAAAGNGRRFVDFPYGRLAFLGSHEPELGDFQSCALFSPMDMFDSQVQALATARASMLALLAPPVVKASSPPRNREASRRRFLGLGASGGENTRA